MNKLLSVCSCFVVCLVLLTGCNQGQSLSSQTSLDSSSLQSAQATSNSSTIVKPVTMSKSEILAITVIQYGIGGVLYQYKIDIGNKLFYSYHVPDGEKLSENGPDSKAKNQGYDNVKPLVNTQIDHFFASANDDGFFDWMNKEFIDNTVYDGYQCKIIFLKKDKTESTCFIGNKFPSNYEKVKKYFKSLTGEDIF